MNTNNVEEIYKVIKYSFNKYDVSDATEAHNIALRFFDKYYKGFSVKGVYYEFDFVNLTHNIYITY